MFIILSREILFIYDFVLILWMRFKLLDIKTKKKEINIKELLLDIIKVVGKGYKNLFIEGHFLVSSNGEGGEYWIRYRNYWVVINLLCFSMDVSIFYGFYHINILYLEIWFVWFISLWYEFVWFPTCWSANLWYYISY